MIELFEQNLQKMDRQSSKGNQLKWESENIWYKADYTGYEGLAEYLISHLLQYSTLQDEEYVMYSLEEICYKRQVFCGVKSNDFLHDDWQIITLERLFHNRYGTSLTKAIYNIEGYKERLYFLTSQVERLTNLSDFGAYMSKLLAVDALFLNEDRHMHNIAVLMNGKGEFAYCPIFDNGAGLLADITMDYPMGENIEEMITHVKAKTIGSDFDEQLIAAEELYGEQIKFYFNKKDVRTLLDAAEIYPTEVRERVFDILSLQMGKYQYLLSGRY